jgi:hypothetical protein
MARVALTLLAVLIGSAVAVTPARSVSSRVDLRIYDPAMQSRWEVRTADVVRSSAHASRGLGGSASLYLRLTASGAVKFRRLTRDLARRGARLRRAQRFVLKIDGRVYARPLVDYHAFPDGVDGRPGIQIEGMPLSTAQRLARRIRGA